MDYDGHIRSDSVRLRQVLASVAPDTPVPTCPGWEASDLLWHLTEVQMFWAIIVENGFDDPEQAETRKRSRPETHQERLAMFDAESARLSDALAGASDNEAAWTWSTDRSVGFIRRRQAHEALIHRVDAEVTARSLTGVHPELATDGIDEVLTVFVGGIPDWATFEPNGSLLGVHATDTRRLWNVRFGVMHGTSPISGTTYDLAAVDVVEGSSPPDGLIGGPAADLCLWLWGRSGIEGLTLTGDAELAGSLRALVAEATQ